MTTPSARRKRRDARRRFSSPIIGVPLRPDGSRVDDGRDRILITRLALIAEAWRTLYATGDRTDLVTLGILPEAE